MSTTFVVLALALAACGGAAPSRDNTPAATALPSSNPFDATATTSSTAPSEDGSSPPEPAELDEPPDLVIRSGAGTARRRPYTYCWTTKDVGVCADGFPTTANRVRVRGALRLSFSPDSWTLTATRSADLDDPETTHVALRDAGDGEWVVAEPLPAGRHVLDIAGRGPETGGEPSGDAFWSIPVIVLDAT